MRIGSIIQGPGIPVKVKVLPCRIAFSGEVNSDGYLPENDEGSIFGRKLLGREVNVPDGFKGVVVQGSKELTGVGEFSKIQYWNWDLEAKDSDQIPQVMQHLQIMSALARD